MRFSFFNKGAKLSTDAERTTEQSHDMGRFFIISTPRTGSNLLCGALDAHPEIICHYELFHKQAIYHSMKYGDECIKDYSVKRRDRNPKDFLDHVFRFRFGKDAKVIGCKIFSKHNDAFLHDLIKNENAKKIILRRRNLLMAYLSQLEAQHTGVYIVASDTDEQFKETDIRVSVDIDKFKRFENTNRRFFDTVKKRLADSSQEYIELEYESALSNENRVRVLEFLNVTVNPDLLKLEYLKQNKRSLKERIINYNEVQEVFSGTEYEKYLFQT